MSVELGLLGVLIFQQLYFMWQIQKLVDKLMSRSYTEYAKATEPSTPRVKLENTEAKEDFGVLADFMR